MNKSGKTEKAHRVKCNVLCVRHTAHVFLIWRVRGCANVVTVTVELL